MRSVELRAIKAQHRFFLIEQKTANRFCQFGLSRTGWAQKQQIANRTRLLLLCCLQTDETSDILKNRILTLYPCLQVSEKLRFVDTHRRAIVRLVIEELFESLPIGHAVEIAHKSRNIAERRRNSDQCSRTAADGSL